jgi:hypothetical protein
MREIKVAYRAVFEQPTGALNPMGLKLPGPFPVELLSCGQCWLAREVASPRRVVYSKLSAFASLAAAKLAMREVFVKQVQDWQLWGTPPGVGAVERLLTPYDVADLGNGKFAWLDDEDRTHILHGPLIDPKAKVPNAACGAKVNAKCFISTKANIEPTCRPCAEVWRKEYQNR